MVADEEIGGERLITPRRRCFSSSDSEERAQERDNPDGEKAKREIPEGKASLHAAPLEDAIKPTDAVDAAPAWQLVPLDPSVHETKEPERKTPEVITPPDMPDMTMPSAESCELSTMTGTKSENQDGEKEKTKPEVPGQQSLMKGLSGNSSEEDK